MRAAQWTMALALALPAAGAAGHAGAAGLAAGVNLSGMEFNAGTIPGVPNTDYPIPTDSELAYYQGKGVMLIRLPILWERLQPGLISCTGTTGAGDPPILGAYLQSIRTLISQAGARGMGVVVDLHDYGGYGGWRIGDGTLTQTEFTLLWTKLAKALRGRRGLAGYDLMNEPSDMPSPSVWPAAAQAAVTAIRTEDSVTPIYVEGDDWSSAATWQQYNATLSIADPSNAIVYEGHAYGDQDDSGTHFVWAQVAAAGVTVQTIADRIAPFSAWCGLQHVACMIGEVGVGNDDPNWNVELSNGLAAAAAGGMLSFTYWAGGPWWGTYPMSIEPNAGVDAPQMSVVEQYGAAP